MSSARQSRQHWRGPDLPGHGGPVRGRLGAMGMVGAGALVSGAASVAGLALATRVLGADGVGPLAVAWALAVVVGPGLWSSVEQEAARGTARGEPSGDVARVVVRRAAVAAVAVAVAGLALRHRVFAGSVAVPLALAVIAVAYGPLHLAWGRLAGERRSPALAATVAVEGVARFALVGGTALVTHDAGPCAWALAAAVAAAAVVATVVAGPGSQVTSGSAAFGAAGGVVARVRSLTWAGLLSQGLFLTSPATFALLTPAGDPRTARLAMAVVLARAPALAWKGVLAAVVPAVAADSDATPTATAAVGKAVLAAAVGAAAVGAIVVRPPGRRRARRADRTRAPTGCRCPGPVGGVDGGLPGRPDGHIGPGRRRPGSGRGCRLAGGGGDGRSGSDDPWRRPPPSARRPRRRDHRGPGWRRPGLRPTERGRHVRLIVRNAR